MAIEQQIRKSINFAGCVNKRETLKQLQPL